MPNGSTSSRTSSRRRRFSLLRATAVCRCRGTTIPTRICARGEALTRTRSAFVRRAFPSRRMRSSSGRRVTRAARGNSRWLGAGVLRRQFHRQPLASLFATAAQNVTPPPRLHACTKAVRAHSTLVARTICGFTHDPISKKSCWISWRKKAKNRGLHVVCQRLRCCSHSRVIDFSTPRAYVRRPCLFPHDLWN